MGCRPYVGQNREVVSHGPSITLQTLVVFDKSSLDRMLAEERLSAGLSLSLHHFVPWTSEMAGLGRGRLVCHWLDTGDMVIR